VVPIHLTEEWNILSRTILPVVYQDPGAGGSDFGLGDATEALYLSPRRRTPSGWTWALGPIFLLPTATKDALGQDRWGAGPALGLLNQEGPWTFGLLANTIWGFAGSGGRVNTSYLQPSLDYTFDSKTTLSVNTESTYDWVRRQWTVPIHFVVRQLFDFGEQRVSVGLGYRYYAESPAGGPEWGLRLGVTIVLPR
jgi:hypothetical protein